MDKDVYAVYCELLGPLICRLDVRRGMIVYVCDGAATTEEFPLTPKLDHIYIKYGIYVPM